MSTGSSSGDGDTKVSKDYQFRTPDPAQQRKVEKLFSTISIIERHTKLIEGYIGKNKVKYGPSYQQQVQFQKINKKFGKTLNKRVPPNLRSQLSKDDNAMLKTIIRERKLVSVKFYQFVNKLEKGNELTEHFCRHAELHLKCIREVLSTLNKSPNPTEELSKITIPSLEWIKTVEDPGLLALSLEWKEMQLMSRITYLHNQLRLVVYPEAHVHGIDVHDHKDDFL